MAGTQIKIVQGNIVTREVDAIVNAANRTLLGGGGVDGAIHKAAGPELLTECRSLGGCATGDAKATHAYRIQRARWIIHTVGPIYGREPECDEELLRNCYTRSLELATELGARSIAFPSISTGAYGYPIAQASRVAVMAIRAFIAEHPEALDRVELVTFSIADFRAYERALCGVS